MTWLTRDVAELYTHLSKSWDYKAQGVKVVEGHSNRLRSLLPEHARGKNNFLDFGSGTGKVYNDLIRLNCCPKRVTMIDAAAGMCHAARQKISENLSVQIIHGDEDSLPLQQSGPYDFITLLQVLHHLPSPEITLAKLRAVATDDATLLALVPGPRYRSALFPFDLKQIKDPVGRVTMEHWENLLKEGGWAITAAYDDRFTVNYGSTSAHHEFLHSIGLLGKLEGYRLSFKDPSFRIDIDEGHLAECQHLTFACKVKR